MNKPKEVHHLETVHWPAPLQHLAAPSHLPQTLLAGRWPILATTEKQEAIFACTNLQQNLRVAELVKSEKRPLRGTLNC